MRNYSSLTLKKDFTAKNNHQAELKSRQTPFNNLIKMIKHKE